MSRGSGHVLRTLRLAWGALREPLSLVRIGLALIMLVRHDDLLRGWVDFEHHAWGPGPEFGAQSLARAAPTFVFPLLSGWDALLPYSDLLVRLRLGLSLLLLFGLLPRLNALLLALLSMSLLVADGFRYLHHLCILYLSLLWLAFPSGGSSPSGSSSSFRNPRAIELVRAQVLVIYFFAGLAKCTWPWLSGKTLAALEAQGFIDGVWMDVLVEVFGHGGLAWGIAALELSLPVLLVSRRTRRWGLALGLLLHLGIHMTMLVSTFGGTLVVLLLSFLPTETERRLGASLAPDSQRRSAAGSWPGALARSVLPVALVALVPLAARLAGTGIGSLTMFTRLVHYELRLSVDGHPVPRSALVAHMGRDGARIVRLANGHGIGEVNVELLRRSLPRLVAFLCSEHVSGGTARAELAAQRIEGGEVRRTIQVSRCGSAGVAPTGREGPSQGR